MKNLTLLALLVGTLYLVIIGCSSDIILESTSDLRGNFVGTYTITSDFGSSNAVEKFQPIKWTFTDLSYIMKINTDSVYDPNYSVCRVDGKYQITSGVEFTQLHSLPDEDAGFNACEERTNPKGLFTLIKSNHADTLRLTQFDSDANLFKEIKLYRISSAE